jgi:hypothetical protein
VTGMVMDARTSIQAPRPAQGSRPASSRVAYLQDGNISPVSGGFSEDMRAAAASLGLTLLPYSVDTTRSSRKRSPTRCAKARMRLRRHVALGRGRGPAPLPRARRAPSASHDAHL